MRDDQIVMEWVIAVGDMPRWEKLLKELKEGRYEGMKRASCANKLDITKMDERRLNNGEKQLSNGRS